MKKFLIIIVIIYGVLKVTSLFYYSESNDDMNVDGKEFDKQEVFEKLKNEEEKLKEVYTKMSSGNAQNLLQKKSREMINFERIDFNDPNKYFSTLTKSKMIKEKYLFADRYRDKPELINYFEREVSEFYFDEELDHDTQVKYLETLLSFLCSRPSGVEEVEYIIEEVLEVLPSEFHVIFETFSC